MDQFKEENKQEVAAMLGLEGNEDEVMGYRKQLDADRKKAIKDANKKLKEAEKAKKRKIDEDDSDSGDSKKEKKKSKKRSKRSESDSDSDSEGSKKEKRKDKKRSKKSDSDSDSEDSDRKSKKKDKDKKRSKKKDRDKDKDKKKKKNKDKDKDTEKSKDKRKSKAKDKDQSQQEPKDATAAAIMQRAPVVVDKEREKPGTIICVLRNNFGMVEKKILKTGYGRKPDKGNTVKFDYNMYLQSGMKKIYSTKDKYQKPYELIVGCEHVMKGWDEGVMSMRLGEQARLTISGKFGYGINGNKELGVPSMADLVLDIDVHEISDDVILPSFEEIQKRKIAQKTVFIDRNGDRMGDSLKFNSAPF